MTQSSTPLSTLRNVGPQSVAMLATLGVHSVEDLEAAGTVAVYGRLKAAFPKRVTLMSLYALEAGLMDLDVLALPPEIKDALRAAAAASPHGDDRGWPGAEVGPGEPRGPGDGAQPATETSGEPQ